MFTRDLGSKDVPCPHSQASLSAPRGLDPVRRGGTW